jgi:hypothetical protein
MKNMAGKTGSKRHTHKYFKLGADRLWHCGDARCTHYMPGNMPPPVWKESICWNCGKTFELTPDNMKFDNPTCDKCPPYMFIPEVEEVDEISEWIERKEREARMKQLVKPIEKDEIEVIEPDEEHAADCSVYSGEDCDCRMK